MAKPASSDTSTRVDASTCLGELNALLEELELGSLSIQLRGVRYEIRGYFRALSTPWGAHAMTENVIAPTLALALALLVEEARGVLEQSIQVRDRKGRLVGLYPRTVEGRRFAERHEETLRLKGRGVKKG